MSSPQTEMHSQSMPTGGLWPHAVAVHCGARILLGIALLIPLLTHAAVPAFRGAQGAGATAMGGRNGHIMEVTRLDDAGPGTLRACVDATGPRICVFRIGGEIALRSTLYITNPYLTVAGQTAPGGGILLSGKSFAGHMVLIATHDVIWRYTRIRKGYVDGGANNSSAFGTESRAYRVIFDHNSVSWSMDDMLNVWRDNAEPTYAQTFSWNLVGEGLQAQSTAVIVGAETSALADGVTDIDFHHNLIMNDNHRNPNIKVKSSRIVNNLLYNHAFYSTHIGGGAQVDLIGNIYKRGPMTDSTRHEIQVRDFDPEAPAANGTPGVFLSNNIGWNQSHPELDQWALASRITRENGAEIGPVPTAFKRNAALPASAFPIVADGPTEIQTRILGSVGASGRLDCDGTWISNRDPVDARLVAQYQHNTGNSSLISSEAEVGGFPPLAAGSACPDADHDGMPDRWETRHGLQPNDARDASADRNGDGFTNVEEYLDASDMAPVAAAGTSRKPASGSDCERHLLPATAIQAESGFAYVVTVEFGAPPDTASHLTQSPLKLFENEQALGPAHAPHPGIRSPGRGSYSHWGQSETGTAALYFSTSDNSDPRSNGRTYSYCSSSDSGRAAATKAMPQLTFTAPLAGATVSAAVDLEATVKPAVAALAVEFHVDGKLVHAVSHSPYRLRWDSRTSSNGLHTLEVRARNAAGSVTLAATRQITVNNAAALEDTPCTQIMLDVSRSTSDEGYANFLAGSFGTAADQMNAVNRSTLSLYENGLPLGPAHAAHNEIRTRGRGRFSHWAEPNGSGEAIRFASSDNSDPRRNRRRYTYCVK